MALTFLLKSPQAAAAKKAEKPKKDKKVDEEE
jgi:hypothetical protein